MPLATELLAAGADVNARLDDNSTPLLTLTQVGSHELLRCLIEAGADVNVMSTGGYSPMLLVWDRIPPDVAILDMFIKAGGDVNQTSPEAFSLLDNFTWQLERIESARASDPLRVKYKEDYITERHALIDFLISNGAIHKVELSKPKKRSTNRIQRLRG